MKKKNIMLPCLAAIAIAIIVGKKTFESHANETSSLLMQNVEALSQSSWDTSANYNICYSESKVAKGRTYYDCGNCRTKVYDEKGVGKYSKCFY